MEIAMYDIKQAFLHDPKSDELFSSVASINGAGKLIDLDVDDHATQKQAKKAIAMAITHAQD